MLSRSTADIDRGNTGANLVLMALHSEPHRGLALWPAGEVKSSPRRGGSERGCVLERSPARPRRGWFGRSGEKAQPGHCHLGARPIRGARPLPGLAARRKAQSGPPTPGEGARREAQPKPRGREARAVRAPHRGKWSLGSPSGPPYLGPEPVFRPGQRQIQPRLVVSAFFSYFFYPLPVSLHRFFSKLA